MKKTIIKCLVASLAGINCLTLASSPAVAGTILGVSNNLNSLESYAHKDNKSKGLDVFSEKNSKYLSSEQKKELKELKKCKDKGETLTEDQQKTLHSIIDSIIKGKLGDKKYEDYKCLIEKKRSNSNLSEEENKKLKDYNDLIDGTKPTTNEIINEFLR